MEYFSIFSNDFNFNTINIGDELIAVITQNSLIGKNQTEQESMINSNQRETIIEMSTKNEILQNSKFLSIQNIMDPSTYDHNSDLFVRLGKKTTNNVQITNEDNQYFEKYGIYPYDVQIHRCSTLKNIVITLIVQNVILKIIQTIIKSNRQNMIKNMRLKENGSLNGHFTNKNLIQEMLIDYKRRFNS